MPTPIKIGVKVSTAQYTKRACTILRDFSTFQILLKACSIDIIISTAVTNKKKVPVTDSCAVWLIKTCSWFCTTSADEATKFLKINVCRLAPKPLNTGNAELDSDLGNINANAKLDFGSFKTNLALSYDISDKKID